MLAALAAIGILLPASRAAAARIDITPSISLDQGYDTNVFNTNRNEKGDFILRVTPAVTFSIGMLETTLNLRTSLTSDTYYKYSELNSTNSAVSLAIDLTSPIRVTPRFSIVPSAHFVQAKNSNLRNQSVPAGDPLQPASIATENQISSSRDYGAALRGIYLLTEKSEFSLGGGFTKLQFLDNVAGGNVDSQVVTGDTTLTYKFTPRLSSGLFFNTASNTFGNGRDSRTYSGGLTGSYIFSPALAMSARAGASRATETGQTGLPDRTTWSPAVSLSLTYAPSADFSAALTGSIDQAGGGSLGQTTRRETVGLSFSDRFAMRWTANLSGSYQQNRALDAADSEDLTSVFGTAGIGYQPATWATLHLSGTASRQWSEGALGTDLTRYTAFLGITLGTTYNIY
jgi:hypothetical protein